MIVSLQIDKHALDYACFVLCKSSKTFSNFCEIFSFSSTKNRVVGFEVLSDLLGCTSALSNEA